MPATEFAKYMELVVNQISNFLKPLGFKKQRHTFNKWTQDGLCYVFNLQMGVYPLGTSNPTLIAPNLYGKFTANLGIFIPEVYREMMGKDAPTFISEPCCALRARFNELTKANHEYWWDLSPDPESNASELIDLLRSYGLPFFYHFPTRQSVIEGLVSFKENYNVTNRPKLDIAIILDNIGEHERAIDMFNQHYREALSEQSPNKGHIKYLQEMAIKHKWEIK